jgi:nitrous oxidase accessory protein NosD
MSISRREVLATGLALVALAAGPRLAREQWAMGGVRLASAGEGIDQTAVLQQAIDAAAGRGEALFLAPGVYATRRLTLPSGSRLVGVPGRTILRYRGGGGLIGIAHTRDVILEGLVFDGSGQDMHRDGALLAADKVERLTIRRCQLLRSGSAGIRVSSTNDVTIAGNLVAQAATGIVVSGGRQLAKPAIVQGNFVRSLFFRKLLPAHGNGIAIAANAVVSGNVVGDAPGFGILVGGEAHDVSITDNAIRNAHIGIGLPHGLAERALIAGNHITAVRDGAIRAMIGPRPLGPDLAGWALSWAPSTSADRPT